MGGGIVMRTDRRLPHRSRECCSSTDREEELPYSQARRRRTSSASSSDDDDDPKDRKKAVPNEQRTNQPSKPGKLKMPSIFV